ncbi:MAG: sulfatase maturase [Methylotenera sp.]|nr:MAG: sulfatase maturase [Methylotenera sp.]
MNYASKLKVESSQQSLLDQYQRIREESVQICSKIQVEDYAAQPMPDVSPPKWHLGHTTWFFEEMLLSKFYPNYSRFNQQFHHLFNSYYKVLGAHTVQGDRGNLSRPTVAQILEYRNHVDLGMMRLFNEQLLSAEAKSLVEIGLHHEQQHQELLYMDIKYILGSNLLDTRYSFQDVPPAFQPQRGWTNFSEGLYQIGHVGEGFAYDNEKPLHQSYCYPFSISKTLVTNGEFLSFIEDEGYAKPEFWLSQGWDWVSQNKIQQPLYWSIRNGLWYEYSLYGSIPLDMNRPLVHISYFEANAFANWKNERLPTEQELEIYLNHSQLKNSQIVLNELHPNNAGKSFGEVWCWTSSQYSAYPRFKPYEGVLKEYNGKFMCNQFVLKGGCVVTPSSHYRHSYRNFYQAHQRWHFSGIRLAKDIL